MGHRMIKRDKLDRELVTLSLQHPLLLELADAVALRAQIHGSSHILSSGDRVPEGAHNPIRLYFDRRRVLCAESINIGREYECHDRSVMIRANFERFGIVPNDILLRQIIHAARVIATMRKDGEAK